MDRQGLALVPGGGRGWRAGLSDRSRHRPGLAARYDTAQDSDVIITMGCGDACPIAWSRAAAPAQLPWKPNGMRPGSLTRAKQVLSTAAQIGESLAVIAG